MSNRFNNKNLFLILGGLLVIFLLTIIVKIPAKKSTLKERLLEIDTSAVSRIEITPKGLEERPFEFVKQDNKWKVRQGDILSEPRNGAVRNIFTEALSIKPQSLAGVDRSMWQEFELTDSLATRIKFFDKKDREVADLMIGKFIYRQVSNPYAYGGNNIEGTSFVRLYDDRKIYAVEGFLAFSFGGGFNDWRDKSFVRCNKDDIVKISFLYPADSGYILVKKDSLWFAGTEPADSLKTSRYLSSLSYVDGDDFMDGFRPASTPSFVMKIEGNNLLSISIKCYYNMESDNYILNSTQNPEIYFTGPRTGLFEKLFKPQHYFQ